VGRTPLLLGRSDRSLFLPQGKIQAPPFFLVKKYFPLFLLVFTGRLTDHSFPVERELPLSFIEMIASLKDIA